MSATTANVRTAMAESSASSSQPRSSSAPSYLVAGVLFYGAVGWLLDQWLGTRFLVAAGVLLGAGLGTYMMIVQLNRLTADEQGTTRTDRTDQTNDEESE
ncbi:AtpZ/AtpI family protein [Nocardioides cavernae]|uniref:AtpZ/AtpI family protein n=1 Tax=Nocardioides cavernae TaxID=1921566 RepID=UPI00211BDB1D|nr:AtpZ/AtpI family protein [Nocardioides cavernae]